MIHCAPIPVRIAHLDFVQDRPSSSPPDASYTNADKHTPYFAALGQWLDRSEDDDAIYAQAYSSFKPFEDEFDALSASISSLDSSEGSPDSESSTSGSPPSSVSALNVKHPEGLSSSSDLQKLSPSTPPKPVSRTGLWCTLTLPTPISLSGDHPPRIDEHGRLQPFEETQTERQNREDFVKQNEYARRLELMGSNAGVGAEDILSSEDWGLRHALVVPIATDEIESDGGAKGDLEELITVNVRSCSFPTNLSNLPLPTCPQDSPRRRRHRSARPRTRPTPASKCSPAERQAAAHTIQLAYRSHLERTAVLATIIDEIESIAYEAREAFFSEIEREETKVRFRICLYSPTQNVV
jgi:hypothetical protein